MRRRRFDGRQTPDRDAGVKADSRESGRAKARALRPASLPGTLKMPNLPLTANTVAPQRTALERAAPHAVRPFRECLHHGHICP